MLSKVKSGAVVGLDGVLVNVEVDITKKGFGAFKIVGLPTKAVDEAKDRVRTAIENSGLEFTKYRLTVNLAPANLPKEGPTYDLPIAIGTLRAMEQINEAANLESSIFFGELSLDGSLNSTPAILPLSMLAREHGIENVYVPAVNAREASIVEGITVFPVQSLHHLIMHLNQNRLIKPIPTTIPDLATNDQIPDTEFTLSDVKGQEFAKRALVIAAAGGHNILLNGPPGAGKTFMARILPSLLPPLSWEEAMAVTKIHSISHTIDPDHPLITTRPFRSPHHSTSRIGLIGGSSQLTPGEISLAHRGVLFLDEIPEFPRSVLESLRQPLEDGMITISRARGTVQFPARFMLVASSNPCPCGWYKSTIRKCICSPNKIANYQRRLSGPLLDRIDLHTTVKAIDPRELMQRKPTSNTTLRKADPRELIQSARENQHARYREIPIHTNAELNAKLLEQFCPLSPPLQQTLITAAEKMALSARAIHKVIKISRTIADLETKNDIQEHHLAEALSYRQN